MSRLLLLPLLAVALTGCWKERSYPDRLVWSDDGAEIGVVQLTFEERDSRDPLNGTTYKRNFRHQIFTRAAGGGALKPVGPEVPGQDGGSLFYMRRAGYFLVTRLSEDHRLEWRMLRSDGSYHALATAPLTTGEGDCSTLDLVPSPDGSRIARVERGASCSATGLTVTFIDPDTLQPVANATVLPARYWSDWTWTPAQEFVVIASEGAWRVSPGAAPVSVATPSCTTPKTTSGETDAKGRALTYWPPNIQIGPPEPARAFGCGR